MRHLFQTPVGFLVAKLSTSKVRMGMDFRGDDRRVGTPLKMSGRGVPSPYFRGCGDYFNADDG
jgi:hypothetical protein